MDALDEEGAAFVWAPVSRMKNGDRRHPTKERKS
jgi:hypothetical protein